MEQRNHVNRGTNVDKGNLSDLHLKFGSHVSNYHVPVDLSKADRRFLPSFGPRSGLLLPEPDIYKLVIESLLGNSNDVLVFDHAVGEDHNEIDRRFVLSYTARHMHLSGATAAALQPLLEWFASLATNIQLCRRFAYGHLPVEPSSAARSTPSFAARTSSAKKGDSMTVREALQSTVVDLIASVEGKLCALDAAVSSAEHASNRYTLISLYVSCRSWVALFQSMTALVKTVLHPSPCLALQSSSLIKSTTKVQTSILDKNKEKEKDREKEKGKEDRAVDYSDASEAYTRRIESENVSYVLLSIREDNDVVRLIRKNVLCFYGKHCRTFLIILSKKRNHRREF